MLIITFDHIERIGPIASQLIFCWPYKAQTETFENRVFHFRSSMTVEIILIRLNGWMMCVVTTVEGYFGLKIMEDNLITFLQQLLKKRSIGYS